MHDEDPIDVRNVGALVVHGQFDLVDLVPDELFPQLSTRGETSYQKLGQEGLGLGLGVNDSEAPWTTSSISVSHFGACWGVLATPYEVPYDPSDLRDHPGVGVPTRGQVPHRGQKDLVGDQDPSGQGQQVVAPSNELTF